MASAPGLSPANVGGLSGRATPDGTGGGGTLGDGDDLDRPRPSIGSPSIHPPPRRIMRRRPANATGTTGERNGGDGQPGRGRADGDGNGGGTGRERRRQAQRRKRRRHRREVGGTDKPHRTPPTANDGGERGNGTATAGGGGTLRKGRPRQRSRTPAPPRQPHRPNRTAPTAPPVRLPVAPGHGSLASCPANRPGGDAAPSRPLSGEGTRAQKHPAQLPPPPFVRPEPSPHNPNTRP